MSTVIGKKISNVYEVLTKLLNSSKFQILFCVVDLDSYPGKLVDYPLFPKNKY